MVSLTRPGLCAIVAFVSMIQPCPAPPVVTAAVAVAASAEAALGAVISAEGFAAAGAAASAAGATAALEGGLADAAISGIIAAGIGFAAAAGRRDLNKVEEVAELLEEFNAFYGKAQEKRQDKSDDSIHEQLGNCMDDAKVNPTMIIYRDYTIVVNGLPPSCMAEIEEYNAQPDIAALNAVHGQAIIINTTAIYISNIPKDFDDFVERLAVLMD